MALITRSLDCLLTGQARSFTRPGSRSAIAKQPWLGPLKVTRLGLQRRLEQRQVEDWAPRLEGAPTHGI